MDYCLGIDTSNYTTSLAALPLSGAGEVYAVRRLLSTPAGAVGLRQSDAHFLHTKNLPELTEELKEKLPEGARFTRVTVSSRPRNVEGSYMPCFLAGVSAAHLAALGAGAQYFETSHQEGHIAAALYGCPDFPDTGRFYSMHLSGGTMELIEVTVCPAGFDTRLISGTLDVTAGQLIDRTGVLLGLEFPCGKALDALACTEEKAPENVRIPHSGTGVNLSGLENRVHRMKETGERACAIARFLFEAIAAAIMTLYEHAPEPLPLLLCGGVSASRYLREHITHEKIFFTDPALCTDNAVGVALIGREKGGVPA